MQTQLKLAIGCDLAAYDFKIIVRDRLLERGYQLEDLGCNSSFEGDFPHVAEKVAKRVVAGEFDRGLLLCGTGQGMAIAANKVQGVRAALCYDIFPALMSREHNDTNILCSGCWLISPEKYLEMVETWLFGKFAGGRHAERIAFITKLEAERL